MKNWIRVDGHYINLDQIIEIRTEEERINYSGPYPDSGRDSEPCVIFVRSIAPVVDGMSGEEIKFFGKEREGILAWLEHMGIQNVLAWQKQVGIQDVAA